jgi:SAM-dependent methyltransferase
MSPVFCTLTMGIESQDRSESGGESVEAELAPAATSAGPGGYDIEYRASSSFWGPEPGSLLQNLDRTFPTLRVKSVLDVGCGEGKNAAFFARRGAEVEAYDISRVAIAHARDASGAAHPGIRFMVADVSEVNFDRNDYDVVVAYGLFHCLGGFGGVEALVTRLKQVTRPGGVHIVCALNARLDGFTEGHVAFRPSLCGHTDYLAPYQDWDIVGAADSDLTEAHPPNYVVHTHAATRFYARRPI